MHILYQTRHLTDMDIQRFPWTVMWIPFAWICQLWCICTQPDTLHAHHPIRTSTPINHVAVWNNSTHTKSGLRLQTSRIVNQKATRLIHKKVHIQSIKVHENTHISIAGAKFQPPAQLEHEISAHILKEVGHDEFILTAYALDKSCTGKSPNEKGFGITASGVRASVGRTIAVDPRIIPYGTIVYISGLGWFVAEDTGGAIRGHHIDVLVGSRHEAIQFGVKKHRIVEIFRNAQTSAFK